jgi:hypothetical protein
MWADDDTSRVREAYGDHTYRRLAEVKTKYDPDNAFHHNKNIRPVRGSSEQNLVVLVPAHSRERVGHRRAVRCGALADGRTRQKPEDGERGRESLPSAAGLVGHGSSSRERKGRSSMNQRSIPFHATAAERISPGKIEVSGTGSGPRTGQTPSAPARWSALNAPA